MSIERFRESEWALPLATIGGLAVGFAFGLTGSPNLIADNAKHAFERTYTDGGKCLSGGPYDPANGAVLNVNHDQPSGDDILSVMPRAANAYSPSVLFLTVQPNEHFTPGDHNTEGFLAQKNCPTQ